MTLSVADCLSSNMVYQNSPTSKTVAEGRHNPRVCLSNTKLSSLRRQSQPPFSACRYELSRWGPLRGLAEIVSQGDKDFAGNDDRRCAPGVEPGRAAWQGLRGNLLLYVSSKRIWVE